MGKAVPGFRLLVTGYRYWKLEMVTVNLFGYEKTSSRVLQKGKCVADCKGTAGKIVGNK